MYLYAKDPYEAKYQLLINKWESAGLKHLNNSKAFVEYSIDMNEIYNNIGEHNPIKECKYWLFLMIWSLIYLVVKISIQVKN